MWDLTAQASQRNISMRRIFTCLMAVIVTAFVWVLFNASSSYAADAAWKGDSAIVYDNKQFGGPVDENTNKLLKLPADAKVYTYVDPPATDQTEPTKRLMHVIYFDGKTDTASAKTAKYMTLTYVGRDNYINPSKPKNIGISSQSSNSSSGTTSCAVSGVGWIVCPVSNFLASSMDWIYEVVSSFLVVKPVASDPDTALFRAWSVMRSFANIAFVIVFLIIIYSQITNFGIDNYGIKRLLPRLIIAAILVNVSYYFCAIAVDISNILGYTIQDVFMNIRKTMVGSETTATPMDWTSMTGFILSGGTATAAGALGATLVVSNYGIVGSIFLLLPVLITGLLSVLTSLLILAGRQAMITVLIIVSPLAFVAYLLPNTEKWFDKWRSTFLTMMVLFPAFAVVFGGAQLASSVIIQNADNINLMILGMLVQVMPLAITPLLIKLSGSTLGQLANIASRLNKPLIDRSRDFTKDRSENIKARRLGTAAERHQFLKRNAQSMDHRKRRREAWRGAHTGMADARWARSNDFSNVDQAVREASDNKSLGESMSELRYNTKKTVAGSRINQLDTQIRSTKEQLANTETRADNMYKGTADHRRHHTEAYQLDTEKNTIEQTLERDLKYRVRNDPAMLRAEMEMRVATDEAATAKGQIDRIHENLRSGQSYAGDNTASINHLTGRARDTAIETALVGVATESAKRTQNSNVHAELTNNASAAAQFAGGVDQYGEVRARASATASIDKQNSENVAAAGTLLSSQNYTPAELITVASGRRRDGTASTSEEQQAAAQQIIQIGYEPDIAQLIDNTTAAARAAAAAGVRDDDNVSLQKSLGSYLAGSSKKPKYFPGPMLGKLSRGEMTEDVSELIIDTLAKEKLSMEVFGEMPLEEMERITRLVATDSARIIAGGALDTPAKKADVINAITESLADPIIGAKFTPAQAKALDNMLNELRGMP